MFKVNEIVSAVGGKLIAGVDSLEFSSFSKDTRTIKNGDFYVPIIGEKFDGHDFILDSIQKGATGFFISSKYNRKEELIQKINALNKGIVIIEVDDTLTALQELAGYNRDRKRHIKLVAVTGSVGKTSTKEMIYSVLEKGFKVLKTEGNFNNHIGLPLTLLKLDEEDVCVVEMGMNNFGEISLLSKLAKPDIAVITNIGVAHIGNLGSQENIFKAKCEILDGIRENGTLVVNGDDQYLQTLKSNEKLKVMKYGIENANVEIRASSLAIEDGITYFHVENKQYKLNCIGKHNVYNALCGMVIGKELGLSDEKILEGYLSYENEKMRMQQIRLRNDILFINDAYNANYDSMKAGIDAVAEMKAKRRIVVLGDMFELGEYSKELHQKIGELLNKNKTDILITCGKDAVEIAKAAEKNLGASSIYHFEDKNDTINKLKELVKEGDTVYFKASRGMKFEELVSALISHIGEN